VRSDESRFVVRKCKDPSLGVARERATPLPQDDSTKAAPLSRDDNACIGKLAPTLSAKDAEKGGAPGSSLSYFNLSQINVRTVFLPVAGSVEGSVTSVMRSPSNL